MDRRRIFIVNGFVVLALSNIKGTDMKEYYCTEKGSWKTAMSSCLDRGGTPVSYLDLALGNESKIKKGTIVWTAEYTYLDYFEDVQQINADYECGYTRFRQSYNGGSWKYKYTPTEHLLYDRCTKKRWYLCESPASGTVRGWRASTWVEANRFCRYLYKLWSGKVSIELLYQSNFYLYSEFWVNSVRRLIQDTLSRPFPTDRHIINCGTSEGINRDGNNSCGQNLQAICKLDYEISDTRFSRSCLQASTTPQTSKKPTENPTKLFNSISTTALVRFSTQSTDTFTKIYNSTKTSLMTVPSTQSKVLSTELINSSDLESTSDGLSRSTIIAIVTAATAVIIGCIVTVLLVLYFRRKRPKREEANSGTVQFARDSPSTSIVYLSNNDNAAGIALDRTKTEVHDYGEACVNAYVPKNKLEHISSNEAENDEYHYVFSVSENFKAPDKTLRRRSITESEYDTTNNVNNRAINESSNIYNKLGYETSEGIYDSTMTKPNRKPVSDSNIYSKTSSGENLYDTTVTAGIGISRLHDAAVCPDDNIYSHAKANDNGDSKAYENIVDFPK